MAKGDIIIEVHQQWDTISHNELDESFDKLACEYKKLKKKYKTLKKKI